MPAFCFHKVRLQATCCGQNGNDLTKPMFESIFSQISVNNLLSYGVFSTKWTDFHTVSNNGQVNRQKDMHKKSK